MIPSFLLALVVLSAATPAPPGERAQLRARYRSMERAFGKAGKDTFDEFLDPEFSASAGPQVRLSRDKYLGVLVHQSETALPPVRVRLKPLELTVDGDEARCRVAEDVSYGARDLAGRPHRVRYTQEYEDRWRKTRRVWRLRSTAYPAEAGGRWLDGKPATKTEIKEALGR